MGQDNFNTVSVNCLQTLDDFSGLKLNDKKLMLYGSDQNVEAVKYHFLEKTLSGQKSSWSLAFNWREGNRGVELQWKIRKGKEISQTHTYGQNNSPEEPCLLSTLVYVLSPLSSNEKVIKEVGMENHIESNEMLSLMTTQAEVSEWSISKVLANP